MKFSSFYFKTTFCLDILLTIWKKGETERQRETDRHREREGEIRKRERHTITKETMMDSKRKKRWNGGGWRGKEDCIQVDIFVRKKKIGCVYAGEIKWNLEGKKKEDTCRKKETS